MFWDSLLFHLFRRHVFFMNSCNLEVKDVRLSSAVLCVSSCPEEQLDTLEELQLFADNNGRHWGMGARSSPSGGEPQWGNHRGVPGADPDETAYPDTAFSAKLEIVLLVAASSCTDKALNVFSWACVLSFRLIWNSSETLAVLCSLPGSGLPYGA